jgi:rare lipoprotein A
MKLIILSLMCFFLLLPVFAQDTIDAFRQEGIASWYGTEFAGRPTASGEIFNPEDMTAAHPKLPFGTFLRVTNTHNGKQVLVRVNDRGPFAAARIIDLSQKAAEELDMILTGTAPVIVEQVNLLSPNNNTPSVPTAASEHISAAQTQMIPEQSPEIIIHGAFSNVPQTEIPVQEEIVSASIPPIQENEKSYRIQVGSYRNAKYAVDSFAQLQDAGLSPAYERYNDLYRVVLAQIESNHVQSVIDTLTKTGFQEILIKEEL